MNHKDQALFVLGLMGAVPLDVVLLPVGWPVMFVPGLWKGYTCWAEIENE